jgi:CRISPR-associated protein Csm2
MSHDTKLEAQKIIADGDIGALIDAAKRSGESLATSLTTSQIRNIFGEVRRIQMTWSATADAEEARKAYRSVVLLQPKLAYQANRDRNSRGVKDLQTILDPCLDVIRRAEAANQQLYFQRFVDYFEAILAYHKAAGGKTVGNR